ncbi:MAG: polyprenyl synthetase family protein [Propionibacteriaceae bacterium]
MGSAPVDGFDAWVRGRLEQIEASLLEVTKADSSFVSEAAQYIINAGGKRFRPLLVVLAACCGPSATVQDVDRAALVVELTHVGSLYHDDVMDEAQLRRGAPSANLRWANSVAILTGDLLFSRASETVADLGPEFVRLQARTFSRLVQGQLAETVGPQAGADPLTHYLQVVSDKTAALIATSALFGAKVAGASPQIQRALAAYGEEIGAIAQLSDDIIDVTSDATGKTPGTDLREGVPTLPTLLARRHARPQDDELIHLFTADLSDPAALARAVELLRAHPAIDLAREEVRQRAEAARGHLAVLPEGPARDALAALCDTVVTRTA